MDDSNSKHVYEFESGKSLKHIWEVHISLKLQKWSKLRKIIYMKLFASKYCHAYLTSLTLD